MRICIAIPALILSAVAAFAQPVVHTGADLLVARELHMLKGKRVGLIVNHTSRLGSGAFLIDTLLKSGVRVTALFGPEHGIRGTAGAGEKTMDGVDLQSGVRIYSLYGENSMPTPAMLRDVDVLLYDIQDVGVRFYTYISTLMLCMDAAAEQGIPIIVLDRPDPLGALVDGPIVDDSLRSFVGLMPVPVVYGLTCGELATFINASGWLSSGRKAELSVVWMEGWTRRMVWQATGLPWVAPSPNIPTPETAIAYPASCFLEATNVSEGRGTSAPFILLGAPFIDSAAFAKGLNHRGLPGVRFTPASFTPRSSKHAGRVCQGVALEVVDRSTYRPVLTGLSILAELLRQRPDSVVLNNHWLGKLLGKGEASRHLQAGEEPAAFLRMWESETAQFIDKSRVLRHYPLK